MVGARTRRCRERATSRVSGAGTDADTTLRVRAAVTIRIPQPTDAAATEKLVRELPFKPGEGDEWLAARQLKIVVDGGILAGTAYMREPYGLDSRALYGVDDPAYRGFLTLTREQIASAIAIGHAHGWQMVAHVTGDAGVDTVLDAIEAAQAPGESAPRSAFEGSPSHAAARLLRQRGKRRARRETRRPDRHAARLVLQGCRCPAAGAGGAAAGAFHRHPHVARRGRACRDQHRSHVRPRSEHVAEPVQSVPDHRHGGDASHGRRSGDWRERERSRGSRPCA